MNESKIALVLCKSGVIFENPSFKKHKKWVFLNYLSVPVLPFCTLGWHPLGDPQWGNRWGGRQGAECPQRLSTGKIFAYKLGKTRKDKVRKKGIVEENEEKLERKGLLFTFRKPLKKSGKVTLSPLKNIPGDPNLLIK